MLRRSHVLLALPMLALIVCALILPIGQAVWWSFLRWDPIADHLTGSFSLEAYRNFLQSYRVGAVMRCFSLSLVASVLTAIVAFPLCCLLRAVGAGVLLTVVEVGLLAPLFYSQALRLHSLKLLLLRDGLAGVVLTGLGVPDAAVQRLVFSEQGIVIGLVFSYSALLVLPLVQSLRSIPESVLFALTDLGVGTVRAARVIGRHALPGLLTGFVLMSVVGWFSSPEYEILGKARSSITGALDDLIAVKKYPEAYAFFLGTFVVTIVLLIVVLYHGKPEALIAPQDRRSD